LKNAREIKPPIPLKPVGPKMYAKDSHKPPHGKTVPGSGQSRRGGQDPLGKTQQPTLTKIQPLMVARRNQLGAKLAQRGTEGVAQKLTKVTWEREETAKGPFQLCSNGLGGKLFVDSRVRGGKTGPQGGEQIKKGQPGGERALEGRRRKTN